MNQKMRAIEYSDASERKYNLHIVDENRHHPVS